MHLVDGAGEHLIALAGLLRPVIQRDWLAFVARRNHADVDELRLAAMRLPTPSVASDGAPRPLTH